MLVGTVWSLGRKLLWLRKPAPEFVVMAGVSQALVNLQAGILTTAGVPGMVCNGRKKPWGRGIRIEHEISRFVCLGL